MVKSFTFRDAGRGSDSNVERPTGRLQLLKIERTVRGDQGPRNPHVAVATRKILIRKCLSSNELGFLIFHQTNCSQTDTQLILETKNRAEV